MSRISRRNKERIRASYKPRTSDGFFWYTTGFMDRENLTYREFQALMRYRGYGTYKLRSTEQ